MDNIINLTINTKSGEDLYVYPYSIKHGIKQKYFYYCPPEFTVFNTNKFFIKCYYNKYKTCLITTKYVLTNWFKEFSYQFRWFFGSNCFNDNFKNYQWNTYISTIKILYEVSYVLLATNVFGKNIILRGQLHITPNHKYIEECYLTPTREYFDERLQEWLNEDVVTKINNYTFIDEEDKQLLIETEIKLRQEYKNWRDSELAKGNKIEYLYSLNS